MNIISYMLSAQAMAKDWQRQTNQTEINKQYIFHNFKEGDAGNKGKVFICIMYY